METELIEDVKKICQSFINSTTNSWNELDTLGLGHMIYYCKNCNALTYDGNPHNIQHLKDCPYKLAVNILKKISEY